MKKSLITTALLAAMTMLSPVMADDEFTVTTGDGYAQNRGNYYGFTVSMMDTFLDATSTSGSALASFDEVVLNSLSLQQRTQGTPSGHTVYLAVYEYSADATTGTFVGVSSNSVTDNATDGWSTFNFTDVTIDPNKQYQYVFVTTNDAGSLTSFADYQNNSSQFGFEMSNIAKRIPTGDGVYTGNDLNSWEGFYMPNVEVSLSATPEPTTATLSLLALAGLCARRRRK